MVNKLWILLSALLMVAMPSAQAGELNLYSMNTGSYVYHMTGNHGQYNEHFNNNFFKVKEREEFELFNPTGFQEALAEQGLRELRNSTLQPIKQELDMMNYQI